MASIYRSIVDKWFRTPRADSHHHQNEFQSLRPRTKAFPTFLDDPNFRIRMPPATDSIPGLSHEQTTPINKDTSSEESEPEKPKEPERPKETRKEKPKEPERPKETRKEKPKEPERPKEPSPPEKKEPEKPLAPEKAKEPSPPIPKPEPPPPPPPPPPFFEGPPSRPRPRPRPAPPPLEKSKEKLPSPPPPEKHKEPERPKEKPPRPPSPPTPERPLSPELPLGSQRYCGAGSSISDWYKHVLDNAGSSISDMYTHVVDNNWDKAKSIYVNPQLRSNMVRIPLNASGDTALHVAVITESTTFVEELVKLMTPQDLVIKNADGNTAFCMAAITGNDDLFKSVMEKYQDLSVMGEYQDTPVLIPGQDEMLPVHLAVLNGFHKIVHDLCSENLLKKMPWKDIKRLFFMTINSSMYDVATKLLEKYPERLIIARYGVENQTALHMLARNSSKEFCTPENSTRETPSAGVVLLEKLWSRVRQLDYKEIQELITHPSVVLFDAVKSGNIDVVKLLLYTNRELLTIKDPECGRNTLHFAVLYRQSSLFNIILKLPTVNVTIRAVDDDGNNVLHIAAHRSMEISSSLRPNIEMHKDLQWFKEVEKRVPLELRTMRNTDGKTPEDTFYANRKNVSNIVKKETKDIARSGMVVAALVATVAFAAALTVPGDKTSAVFIVFILANTVALFTSSASIISFLSIFTTSRFTQIEFIISLHPSLILGLTLLFISIAAMVIAFAAASFLIFDIHGSRKWVAYLVASMGLLPILAFLQLRFSLVDDLKDYYFCSRYIINHQSRVQ